MPKKEAIAWSGILCNKNGYLFLNSRYLPFALTLRGKLSIWIIQASSLPAMSLIILFIIELSEAIFFRVANFITSNVVGITAEIVNFAGRLL